MKSPFKFLDAYILADRNVFFGRDQEITELYRRVFEGKMLLVYGISGTGKSSLVNCGLASKFDESDWLPVNVRRGSNIIDSLNDAFNNQALTPLKKSQSIREKLQSIYLDHFKPVYLLFDQFEELFIFGSQEEKSEFISIVKEITESEIQCRIIFIIREEFLAGMTEFESELPDIFTNRFRVEKMKRVNAISAVEGPCKVFEIETEPGFSEDLIDKLCPAGNEIELTYLQIYLDRIFHIAVDEKKDNAKLAFSKELLTRAGSVSDLLGQFLDEQIREFEDPETGMSILKSFVSAQGTRKQMIQREILDSISAFGTTITEPELLKYLTKFVDLRILRERDEAAHFELRHDTLAEKIYEKFTAIEKDIIEVRQFIENEYSTYEKRGKLLNAEDLKFIAPYEGKLYLNRASWLFIIKSKNELARATRRRRIFAGAAALALVIVLSGFTIWALNERRKAVSERKIAEEQTENALIANEKAVKAEAQALREKEKALDNEKAAIQSREEAEIAKEKAVQSEAAAILERNKAIKNENLAIQAINETELAMERSLKSEQAALKSKAIADLNYLKARASSFNFLSQKVAETDPTIALRLAEYAVSLDSTNPDNIENLYRIYYDNNFYRIVITSESPVNSVAYSPDGKSILTGSNDNIARLVDLNGKLLREFKGHSGPINSIAFSPDGKTFLTGSADKTVRLWDLQGNILQVFEEGIINSVTFSPDGGKILAGSDKAYLWDLQGNLLKVFEGDIVNSVAFSPDGEKLLTGYYDVRLWDMNGKILQVFEGLGGTITSLAFSPDGKNILSAGYYDNSARLWDLKGNMLYALKGHEEGITSVAFSPDGKNIVTASGNNLNGWDKTIRLWDLRGNQIQVCKGHNQFVRSVVFSPDGKNILSGSWDGTIRSWSLQGNVLQVFTMMESSLGSYIVSAAISPDGKTILTNSLSGEARLWDLTGNVIRKFAAPLQSKGVFSPDVKSILTGGYLRDLQGNVIKELKGHESDIRCSVFSPDGLYILTGSMDKTCRLWDIKGNTLQVFKGHESMITAVAFSPDGKTILTGSTDRTARLWDMQGNVLQVFTGHESGINSVSFSPDGKNILTGSGDNVSIYSDFTARLWDLNGNTIHIFKGHGASVNSVTFSPDGLYLLTGSSDKTACLWDIDGKMLQIFRGHRGPIASVVFSPDGKMILTSGYSDHTAWLWEIKKSLKEFQKENTYQELSVEQKIKYGIIDSTDIQQVNK